MALGLAGVGVAIALSATPASSVGSSVPLLYVSDYGSNSITSYPLTANGDASPTGTISSTTEGSLQTPTEPAFDSEGDLWVPNENSETIVEYSASQLAGLSGTSSPTPVVTIENGENGNPLQSPTSVAFDPSGDLWITNLETGTIIEYTKTQLASFSGVVSTVAPALTIGTGGGNNESQGGLAFDSSGDLWEANWEGGTILEYSASLLTGSGEIYPTPTLTISQTAYGLAFDSAGDLWVGGYGALVEYSKSALGMATPGPTITISNSDLDGAEAVALDSTGDLWASNKGNSSVVEYPAGQLVGISGPSSTATPDAVISGTGTGLDYPWGLAVSPVAAGTTSFSTTVDGSSSSATVPYDTSATLAESGLPAAATGTVTFTSGTTSLCVITLPATSCTTSASLPAGTYPGISGVFVDTDGNYSGSTSTNSLSLTVQPAPTSFSTTVDGSSSSATVPYGTSATLAESGLPAAATGTVTFTSGTTSLCVITLPATSCRSSSSLSVGTYPNITGTFIDTDGNYSGSTSTNTVSLTVQVGTPTSFSITVNGSSSSATVPYARSATLAQSGLPAAARGAVSFASGSTSLCVITLPATSCTTPATLASGTYPDITGTFLDGDGDYADSTSTNTVSLTVQAPVVTNCGDSGPGSLRWAVANTGPGGTVQPGSSCHVITLTSGPIWITSDLTIDGPGANVLAVSGDDASTVFAIDQGVTATISGLTVENGNGLHESTSGCSAVGGGGIFNLGILTMTDTTVSGTYPSGILNCGVLTLDTSTIEHNTTLSSGGNGGGIFNLGSLTVNDSTVSDNSATADGGGIDDLVDVTATGTMIGTSTVTGSTFSDNTAQDDGGGIYIQSGTSTVTDSTFSGNSSSSRNADDVGGNGGGISNGGSLTVNDSTFSGNTATENGGSGGGIDNDGTLTVNDSTFSGNSADTGGGIFEDGNSPLALMHVTLSGNSAMTASGGDIYLFGVSSGVATLADSIVAAGGPGHDCAFLDAELTDGGYNLDDDGTCGFSSAEHSLSDTLAGLDPQGLAANGGPTETIALESGSAAIDAVTDSSDCTGSDQRGAQWTTPCDIGAISTVDICPTGSSSCESGISSTAGGSATAADDDTTGTASGGEGTITVSGYPSDPVGTPNFSSTDDYFDVELSAGNNFTSVTIDDCNLDGGDSLEWWNPGADDGVGAWEAVVGDPGPTSSTGPPACPAGVQGLTVTLDNSLPTSPDLSQLVGTVFGVGKTPVSQPTTLKTLLTGSGVFGGGEVWWQGDLITVYSGTAVTDKAILSGVNASKATGTITYTVYSLAPSQQFPFFQWNAIASGGTVTVVDGAVPASHSVTLSPGVYEWQASYSGDTLNSPSTSPFGSETETVIPVPLCTYGWNWGLNGGCKFTL